MKTYKEMTEAILIRVKECRERNRKRIISAISMAASVCVVLTAAFLMAKHNTEQLPTVSREPRLVLVASAAEYEEQENMVEGVVTPLKFLIRVRDIRGINRYRYVIDIIGEEMTFREKIWNEETEDGTEPDKRYTRWQNEDAIISLLSKGFLYLAVEDYDQVQGMSVKTTEAGQATVTRYFHNDEDGEKARRGISINWMLSQTTVDMIQEDPTMKLSDISDTITVAVDFKDGTTETVVIDLTVDDEGQIYVTHKGTTVSG